MKKKDEKNVNILAFDQLYIVLLRTGLYDKREKNEKRIYNFLPSFFFVLIELLDDEEEERSRISVL